MKFFIFGCEKSTPTDGIIYRGTTNLLSKIYPNAHYSYLKEASRFYRDATMLPDNELLAGQSFDAIIIPGSPYLWDMYYTTPKIKNLLRAKEIHKCPVIWLGIGACTPLDNLDLLYTQHHLKATRDIFKDDLVIVRDEIAQKTMELSGVKSHHLICPSYYAQDTKPKTKENLIVFYEPTIGLSFQSWTDPKQLQEYYQKFLDFYKNGADVVCKDPEEVEFGEKIGLKNIRVLKDVDDCLDTVGKYRNVLSGRVHCGIPAYIAGAKMELLPIDSRYLTYQKFDDLTQVKSDQFKIYENLIQNFLK